VFVTPLRQNSLVVIIPIMKASELRRLFIDFFVQKHGHKEIPGASLIPENDPTVLFTTAGMHPLVPYLMGESHPMGARLASVQKCLRTDDVDEVGDATHCTFFEMLGNWSLGDYFKEEAIKMSYEFLTEHLKLDPERLCVSCFEGDDDAPKDEESAKVWKELGFDEKRIFFYGKKENWWGPAGLTGPCGPDTEMFYYTGEDLGKMWDTQPSDDDTPWVEIWNDVFMEYFKNEDGGYEGLEQKNVDTGMGFERVLAIMNGAETHFETELFDDVIGRIRDLSLEDGVIESERIIADHLRAATFILGDENGVTPSNNDQGYVLRKLLRRAIRHGRKLGINGTFTDQLGRLFIGIYGEDYPGLVKKEDRIIGALVDEEKKFRKTLKAGEAEIEKDIARVHEALQILLKETKVARIEMALNAVSQIVSDKEVLGCFNKTLRPLLGKLRGEFKGEAADKDVDGEVLAEVREKTEDVLKSCWRLRGDRAFYYFESYGFPLEMTVEIMKEHDIEVDEEGFCKAFEAHQEKSRAGSEQKFAGGLADHGEATQKLHTAAHLMLEAMRKVLGDHVEQRGSNINGERLRFDFSHPEKVGKDDLAEVEKLVNEAIEADFEIVCEEMTVEEAKKLGATGIFADKYEKDLGGKVKVYKMGGFSTEICGGPHVGRTGELGSFKITKEQSSSAGVRRVKAVLL
jgi:alanyl-tRNA synthetase